MARKKSYRVGPKISKAQPKYLFPPAGDYVIFSSPLFRIKRGENEEVVECEAEMRVSMGDATKAKGGQRRVSITVHEWEAVGHSKLLDGELKYSLLKDLKSYVTAGNEKSDLPGTMLVSGTFAAYLNGKKVDEHQGRAIGLISSFPPARGDLFDISGSNIKLGNISVGGIVCACNSK